MECDCYDTNDKGDEGNEHTIDCYDTKCTCDAPQPPTGFPDCPSPSGDGGIECFPDDEVARRTRELADKQAEAEQLAKANESREQALQALTERAEQLKKALADYKAAEDDRNNRKAACEEFIDCHDADDCECVDTEIERYRTQVEQHKAYVRYLIWAVGHAQLDTTRAQRKHDWAEKHYEYIRTQGTDCLKECETLRGKYQEAAETDDHNKMCLYYRAIEELLKDAAEHCLDPEKYEEHLCKAFEKLATTKAELAEAEAAQKVFEDDLAKYHADLKSLKDSKWTVLEDRIARCCVEVKESEEYEGSTSQQSVGD